MYFSFCHSTRHKQPVFLNLVLAFLLALSTLLFSLNSSQKAAFAQDPTTTQMFEHISQLAEATGSYHAEVTTLLKKKGQTSVVKGHLKFMWPRLLWEENKHVSNNKVRMAYNISNGKVRWNYIPSLKIALKYNIEELNEDAKQKGWISAANLDEASLRYLGKEHLGNEEMYLLEGESSAFNKYENPSQPGKRQIYIDVQNGIIRKMILYNKQNEETDSVTFSNIRKDPSIALKDFDFTPPKGTQIHEVNKVDSKIRMNLKITGKHLQPLPTPTR